MSAADSEGFFIRKITEGLEGLRDGKLSRRDRRILLRPGSRASAMNESDLNDLRLMMRRALRALVAAYAHDTWHDRYGPAPGWGKRIAIDNAMEWRGHNMSLHSESQTFLSGVVQNWYLRAGGRHQEARLSRFTGLFGRKPRLYLVKGADGDSGNDLEMTFAAPDPRMAEQFANFCGLLVGNVVQIDELRRQ